jgi:hypothetical protein
MQGVYPKEHRCGRGPRRARVDLPAPAHARIGSGTAVLDRRVAHYPDIEHGADVPVHTRRGCQPIGVKSVLIAPMLWEGKAIGAIFIGRASVGEFSEKETRLLKTFADQAVIAIHNARLFHAERAMRRYRLLVWIDHTASPAPSLARSQAPAQARCSAAQPSDGVDAFSGTRGPGSPGQEPHVQRLCSAATNSTWR